jgi:predicted helicase
VFGIQVGVGITLAVRSQSDTRHQAFFHRIDKALRRQEKLKRLHDLETASHIEWQQLVPDERNTWLTSDTATEFAQHIPVGSTVSKELGPVHADAIFALYSRGLETTRDAWVYDKQIPALEARLRQFIETYNSELDRWKRANSPSQVDEFVTNDARRIKWSSRLKETLQREMYAVYEAQKVRRAVYRPFMGMYVYFDSILNQRQGQFNHIVPSSQSEAENQLIAVTDRGSEKPFMVFATNRITDLHFVGAGAATQCFPFYVYNEDATDSRENITDWALAQFRSHYKNNRIDKWDIFHYVYGLLHHPGYRERYADNLKRELPRIPFAPDFQAFRDAGRKLAELHLGYETIEPWELEWIESPGVPLSYRIEKMKLAKDKRSLNVNDSLTLAGMPPETFDYRLGNRSALEWVIDQYRVKTDKRSGITSDPNNPDDPEYIVRLAGQVVRVSIETVNIVNSLAAMPFREGD